MGTFENMGRELQRLVREKNVPLPVVSEETGININTLRAMLNGRNKTISTRNLMILARYFGVSARDLLAIFE